MPSTKLQGIRRTKEPECDNDLHVGMAQDALDAG